MCNGGFSKENIKRWCDEINNDKTKFGVVKTKYKNCDWKYWCLCPFIEYGDKAKGHEGYEEIAKMVIAGEFGNGEERRDKVTRAGYDYAKVQKIVNNMLKTVR